jgi:hypothetical protein
VSTGRHAIGFRVWLHDSVGLDRLADEVASALGTALRLSEEPGLTEDYVGELAGLSLWLRVTDPEGGGPPERTVLLAEPDHPPGEDEQWVDIAAYVAQLLRERTGRRWEAGGP